MYDNYPPGAANDPRAPYNQVSPDDVDFKVTVEVFKEDDTSETKELSVTVQMYSDEYYTDSKTEELIRDELDCMFKDVDYDILDFELE